MRTTVAILVALALPVWAADVIQWDEAEKHVGENVTVEGRVMAVHCSPTSCLLAFDPTFNRFTAVVQAANFDTLPPARLDEQYTGRRVRVRGTIGTTDKKPKIELGGADDISLVTTRAERRDAEKQAADVQVEMLERLNDVLASVESLTERLVTTQERIDALLGNLEARLQASQAPQPVLEPPVASYGEPQPRPGYEALRTVKRGMTPADVSRLVGEPQHIEESNSGWVTWYYGYGRSISFDQRGRARSLVGFPPP